LWSVVKVIQNVKSELKDTIVLSDPVGAGFKRGPHNCGKCDRGISKAIQNFSLSQNISVFDSIFCECEELFERAVQLEKFSFGSPLVF